LKKVKDELYKIMMNKNSKITKLLNEKYIMDILETDGKAFTRPWFGQLMTGPQLMAYLIQVEMWLEEYNPEIMV
jgi:asparagine synthase (glutamine-hydrolysing)